MESLFSDPNSADFILDEFLSKIEESRNEEVYDVGYDKGYDQGYTDGESNSETDYEKLAIISKIQHILDSHQ